MAVQVAVVGTKRSRRWGGKSIDPYYGHIKIFCANDGLCRDFRAGFFWIF